MPRCSSAYRAARGKSLPTTPTTCTGWRMDPATLKNTAEPPSASAVSPNGVATESRATDPTTKSDTLHPVRGADAHEREAVRQHLTYGASQHEPHRDRKSTRLNSSHSQISYAVFCLKKKKLSLQLTTTNDQSSNDYPHLSARRLTESLRKPCL